MCLQNKAFKNTVGKGEIARNEPFLLFPVFATNLENFLSFSSNMKLPPEDPLILSQTRPGF